MKRRCYFLDNLPAYNYNTGVGELVTNAKGKQVHHNTQHLGSTLMRAFLREVEEFCHPTAQANWSRNPHQQVILVFTIKRSMCIYIAKRGHSYIVKQEVVMIDRPFSLLLPTCNVAKGVAI